MSSSDISQWSAEDRYGPKLDDYFRTGKLDLSQHEPPTKDEASEAIEALRENLDVTYEDFETILSMEESPACFHLYLLLSTPDDGKIGIFPACVNLLRVYCNAEGNGILDHAYGFLCLRVMSLVSQLAMLAHNIETESKSFEPFYLASTALSEGESVHPVLRDHLKDLFDWAKELDPEKRDMILFGVCYNSETRRVVCLPHCGECSIPDAEFLVERLWSARDKFLLSARWATQLFPGLGVMLDMIRALFAAPHLRASIPMSTWTISDDDQIWVHFLDVATRYSLCCDALEERQVAVMLHKFPKAAQRTFEENCNGYAVDDLDATQVVVDASNRLKSPSDAPLFLSLNAFIYGCNHISASNAANLGRSIFDAYFDRMWYHIGRAPNPSSSQYFELLHSCTSMTHAYMLIVGKFRKTAALFLDYLSEKIIEVHGRMIILPHLTNSLGRAASSMEMYEYQFQTWTSQLTAKLARLRMKIPAELTYKLFPLWCKILEYFEFAAGAADAPRQQLEENVARTHDARILLFYLDGSAKVAKTDNIALGGANSRIGYTLRALIDCVANVT